MEKQRAAQRSSPLSNRAKKKNFHFVELIRRMSNVEISFMTVGEGRPPCYRHWHKLHKGQIIWKKIIVKASQTLQNVT